VNCVCKTPRGLWAKFESAQEENFNPIKLAERDGSPARYRRNCRWNLGFCRRRGRTRRRRMWSTGGCRTTGGRWRRWRCAARGGGAGAADGGRVLAQALAAFAAISPAGAAPHIAWKLVGVAADDPLAASLQDVGDVHRLLPGALEEVREWLRTCDATHKSEPPRPRCPLSCLLCVRLRRRGSVPPVTA